MRYAPHLLVDLDPSHNIRVPVKLHPTLAPLRLEHIEKVLLPLHEALCPLR
jgi:hypothetical protein